MKYIIALDLDETLLNSDLELSLHTKEVLKKCKDKGFVLVISSTRGYGSCKEIAKSICADYVCCHSGNMIVDERGNIIFKNAFKEDEVEEFINMAKKYTNNIIVDSDSNLFGGIDDEGARSWGVIPADIDSLSKMNVYKLSAYYESEYQKDIEEYCKEHNYVCRVMRTGPYLLVTPQNSDKFYALEKLIEIIQTDLNHLIVFGDDNSDLLSIEKAKFGVAVANARQKVLDVAKFVTKSNDEDGVAKFLEENIL